MGASKRYGAAEAARLRHETWQRSHGFMSKAVLVMAAATFLSVSVAVWSLHSKPEPRYFAAREDGGILPLVAVSRPFLTDGQVTNFAVEAATRAMTIDFANWRNDLSDAAEYFEHPSGWNNFLDAVESSGMLAYIRERRLVSTVVANGAVIASSGLDERKRYSWTLQVPLTITYESSSEVSRDSLLAEIVVARLPTWQNPNAVGVTRILVRPSRPKD